MGQVLSGLMALQKIERDLWQLRRRMRSRRNAVKAQEARIAKHRQEHDSLKQQATEQRMRADEYENRLRESEAEVSKLRTTLNGAKTNKEYAAVLTQINTHKADNAKVEEEALKIMAQVDAVKQQAEGIQQVIDAEETRLQEIKDSSAEEIDKLDRMIQDLQAKRDEAAADIPPETLAIFDRLAEQYDGEALAKVEINGKKPPFTYTCGGCFMSLNAEHANALGTRDEIRQCDNCQRILFMDSASQ